MFGAIGRALLPLAVGGVTAVSTAKKINDTKKKIAEQPVQQPNPVFDLDSFMSNWQTQNQLQMKQMQDYYNQQLQSFQSQMNEQNQLRLNQQNQLQQQQNQQNAYQQQNVNRMNNSLRGTIGNYGLGYQQSTAPKGAHIKTNTSGQPAAISRYLAKDIWSNK